MEEKDKALSDANDRLKLKDAVNVEFRLKIEKLEVELSDANKEIERLKGLVYEISKGNINPDTGKEYFSGLDPNKFNKQF